jgi:hypothetical protein
LCGEFGLQSLRLLSSKISETTCRPKLVDNLIVVIRDNFAFCDLPLAVRKVGCGDESHSSSRNNRLSDRLNNATDKRSVATAVCVDLSSSSRQNDWKRGFLKAQPCDASRDHDDPKPNGGSEKGYANEKENSRSGPARWHLNSTDGTDIRQGEGLRIHDESCLGNKDTCFAVKNIVALTSRMLQ